MSISVTQRLPCKYSVVKYIEDVDRDEPVNIGIILQSKIDGKTSSRFIDYKKLQHKFENSHLVKLLLENIQEEISRDHSDNILDKISLKYEGKLRFSSFRGTLAKNFEDETNLLYKRFVNIEILTDKPMSITLPYIKKNVWSFVAPKRNVQRNRVIEGKRSKFRYDFVFGQYQKILHSISYDSPDSLKKTKLFDWNVMDVTSKNGLVLKNFGAIISEPNEHNPKYGSLREHYKEGMNILESKNYDLIHFDDTQQWKQDLESIIRN
jgi:hypothetical protein